MTNRGKKIFLFLSITIPFAIYCIYYYSMVIKDAPYKFAEFDSIVFQYGPGDSLINKYNSKTGEYQYVSAHDSLVKTHLKLSKDDLLYLHRKAADLGFWDFPAVELNDHDPAGVGGAKPPHYLIIFNYKRKSKKVIYDAAYDGPQKLNEANEMLIKEIQKILDEAQEDQKK